MVVGIRGEDGWRLFSADQSPEVQQLLTEGTQDALASWHQRIERDLLELHPYERGADYRTIELGWMDPTDDPEVHQVLEDASTPEQLHMLNELDEIPWRDLDLEVKVLRANGEPFLTVRRLSWQHILQRGRRAFGLREGRLDIVDPSGIYLGFDADAFLWSGTLYVSHPSTFETAFGFYERLRERAPDFAEEIGQQLALQGIERLQKDIAGSQRRAKQAYRILEEPAFEELTIDQLRDLAEKHELSIAFTEDDALDYPASRSRDVFKVLQDCIVRSEITADPFEIPGGSKRPITGG